MKIRKLDPTNKDDRAMMARNAAFMVMSLTAVVVVVSAVAALRTDSVILRLLFAVAAIIATLIFVYNAWLARKIRTDSAFASAITIRPRRLVAVRPDRIGHAILAFIGLGLLASAGRLGQSLRPGGAALQIWSVRAFAAVAVVCLAVAVAGLLRPSSPPS